MHCKVVKCWPKMKPILQDTHSPNSPLQSPVASNQYSSSTRRRERRKRNREEIMPLYDCMLLLKPRVRKEELLELVARVGRRACQRNGVVTDVKSFGTVPLAYGIKKLDGRHFQGQLMQLTMMVPPSFPKELNYLNKEDRLLRWLVVKHRNTEYSLEFINGPDGQDEFDLLRPGNLSKKNGIEDEDDDDDVDDEDEDEDDDDDDDYEDADDGAVEDK